MTNHIKIYGVKPRIQYVANRNLKKYEFPFAIFKTSDVDVYLDDKLLTTSEYEVSVEPDIEGGAISFKVAPSNGTVITIARNLSIERTTDFQEGGALRANVLNDELDYQIACQQQIADSLNRSMVMPPYAIDSDVDLTLPIPSAGKAIVWNKDGTNLENSTVKVNELENTLKGYKTEAQNAATIATNKANVAATQAQTASEKATEVISAANRLNSMRTNCIIEIPQDIKLELTDGTLTLKSGSKAYLPDGSSYQANSDITLDNLQLSGTSEWLICMTGNNTIFSRNISNCVSGADVTTIGGFAYDTTQNKIRWYNASGIEQSALCSFPIAIIHTENSIPTQIKQIFNGFGYIGSTIFALPGVKGLTPNGRNADGTFKTISWNTTSIKTRTFTDTNTTDISFNGNGFGQGSYHIADDGFLYNSINQMYSSTVIGTLSRLSGIVASLKIKTTFCAADYNDTVKYNDKDIVTTWTMPNYEAGISIPVTSGTSYTTLRNGFIVYKINVENGDKIITNLVSCSSGNQATCYTNTIFVPVPKGFTHTISTIQGTNKSTITFYPCLGG